MPILQHHTRQYALLSAILLDMHCWPPASLAKLAWCSWVWWQVEHLVPLPFGADVYCMYGTLLGCQKASAYTPALAGVWISSRLVVKCQQQQQPAQQQPNSGSFPRLVAQQVVLGPARCVTCAQTALCSSIWQCLLRLYHA